MPYFFYLLWASRVLAGTSSGFSLESSCYIVFFQYQPDPLAGLAIP
jgi:hypothetical protein